MLIALPQGLNVSGVTMWGVRLANGLAERGRPVGLVLHREPSEQRTLDVAIDRRVRVFDARALAPFEDAPDLIAHIELYGRAVDELGGTVVVSPNLHEGCYETCAQLTTSRDVRLLGWQHSDIAYDRHLLTRYAPVLASAVGVSDVIVNKLRGALGSVPIENIPYGVEMASACPRREPLLGRPIRLVYTGRIEHYQKRVMSLAGLSRELTRLAIAHDLRVLGDGPASDEFDDTIDGIPSISRVGAVGPAQVREALAWADAFVLPSRYEGLSVSMLEALASGCVPIVARVESGATQAIEPGINGLIADVGPDEDEAVVGRTMAEVIASLTNDTLASHSAAAWTSARDRFSIERHVDRVCGLIDGAASTPHRTWLGGATGTVPPDGAARMESLLRSLAGRRVAIHGVGRHTLELEHVVRTFPVVAFTDDDRQRQGASLWGVPIVPPERASETGATDVVISSWLHESEIWDRRGMYERQGVRVHRVYARETQAA